jgi:hypothetical protein
VLTCGYRIVKRVSCVFCPGVAATSAKSELDLIGAISLKKRLGTLVASGLALNSRSDSLADRSSRLVALIIEPNYRGPFR